METIHLKHHQIDKKKWDVAIKNSQNGLIYALSWFLDIVSPNWEAIIIGDYEFLMPLTKKSKLGVSYWNKPVFAQFFGVFFKDKLNKDITLKMIKLALKKVKYVDVWFNPKNEFPESPFFIKRRTQELKLTDTYEKLANNYSRSNKNNLKKALKEGLIINQEPNIEILLKLLKGMYSRKNVEGVRELDFINLKQIYNYSVQSNKISTNCYTLLKDGKHCAAAFFVEWNKRAIIYHAANDVGRKTRAMFVLIDEFIKKHAGQDLILDFAGSNIPGVAEWNEGFGARSLNYYAVCINKLPIPFRWIKR